MTQDLAPSLPAYHQFEEFQNRYKKLEEIKALGICPYPHSFHSSTSLASLQTQYKDDPVGNSEDGQAGTTPEAHVSGRLVLFRAMGKNAFGQILSDGSKLQVMFNRDATKVTDLKAAEGAPTPIKFIEKKLDLGDILGLKGHLFRTGKGELTLFVKEVTLLTKSLLPLPDKHAGLSDQGVLYRKRWLDLLTNPSSFNNLKMRSLLIREIRQFMDNQAFMEVETPVLQNIYGGAEAAPFVTHLNALNSTMYMRIALEIALKKLVVGGFDRVFEIGKVFRNEGIDRTHNPEFTMLEAYGTYLDYNDVMVLTENLFEHLAKTLFGTTVLEDRLDKAGNKHTIDLKAPWIRMTMKDAIKKYGQIDVDTLSDEEMVAKLKTTDLDPKKYKSAPRGKLIALMFEEFAEHHLIAPHHIIDHPIETTPLCKTHRDPSLNKETMVERFETFILGMEFCNAYTELNDPVLQRQLLEAQQAQKDSGDEEANPMDEEFIEAICQGMPPTGGLGVGLDRLTMLFTNSPSIRDIITFPMMRIEE